jgi:NAD(P)-dependent dehydrogenase (short-subunit alcohol dehydrogenase family)
VADAIATLGKVDVLINSAGVVPVGQIVTSKGPHPLPLFQKTMDINVTGTFNMIRLAASQMIKQGTGGVIINFASISGLEGNRGQLAYAASKGAVLGMTLPLARDLARYNIRVVAFAPGPIWTPVVDNFPEHTVKALTSNIPLGRFGKPEEISHACEFVVGNGFITGCTLRLDGGIRAPHL